MKGLFMLLTLLLLSWMGYGNSANQQGEEVIKHNAHQLACQAPPVDGTTGKLIEPLKPIYRDSFSPREAVWVAIDIDKFKGRKKDARIYVVKQKKENLTDGKKLNDVTGSIEVINFPRVCKGLIYIQVWKRPRLHPKGYDVIVDFSPLGKYDKGKDIIDGKPEKDAITQRGFVVPKQWVCLESISFNHTPNCNYYDAIDIRQNWDIDISPPEWKRGKKSYPAAYIKKRSITVKAVFSAAPAFEEIIIGACKHYGTLDDVCEVLVEFNKCHIFKNFKLGSELFQVYLPTPNEITSFYQEWGWYFRYSGDDKKHYIGKSRNKIFIIFTQPQSPWKIKGRSKPWTDLLDIVCTWANGEITPEGTAAKITYHLYNNIGGIYYEGSDNYTANSYFGDFRLKKFLRNIPKVENVDCADMGKALVTFANVVGCGSNYRRSWPFGEELNCVKPVGTHWCRNREYAFHAFGSIGNKIFDAAFYYVSSSGNPAQTPLLVMTNIPWEDYKRKLIKVGEAWYPETFRFNIVGEQ